MADRAVVSGAIEERPTSKDRGILREVVNAIRHLVRTGCGWEMLPSDFPALADAGALVVPRTFGACCLVVTSRL